MTLRTLSIGLLAGCAASALSSAAFADPPGRVGRVSYVEGEVSFQPPQADFWTQATRNFPIAPQESFWTGDSGRVQLEIGALRVSLDSETELDVVDLDYGDTRLSLPQGSVDFRIWEAPRGGVTVATPAGDVHLDHAGLYRVDVGAPSETGSYPPVVVTSFDGEAAVPSPDGYVSIADGEAAYIDAGYVPEAIDPQDASIDDWAREREARERWQRHDYLSPAMSGADDLDGYGDFQDTARYGKVWFPRDVPGDWAPYRYGHWAYVQPWGWTWVDDQPWGFAPFHYGRWARIDNRWGWVPGQAAPEPVYAPALVAFIGGDGWSVGVSAAGGASMGWVPLAPDEVYRPAYQVSEAYVRRVNVTNVSQTTITNITNITVNTTTVNQYHNVAAATVVPQSSFSRGAPVQRALLPVTTEMLVKAPMVTAANRPAPTPEARSGVGARPGANGQAPGAGAGRVVSAPPPPPRLQAVRAAVAAQPRDSLKPPVIPGATLAPPKPRSEGAPPKLMVAPSQVRNPAAQGRQAPPIAHAPSAGNAADVSSARGSPLRTIPLKSLPNAPPNPPAPPTAGAPRPHSPLIGQPPAAPVETRPRPEPALSRPDAAGAERAAARQVSEAEVRAKAEQAQGEARAKAEAAQAESRAKAREAQAAAQAQRTAAARQSAAAAQTEAARASASEARVRAEAAAKAAAESKRPGEPKPRPSSPTDQPPHP